MASNQKSLEEMLRAEVDESKITALVSQLDQPLAQDTGQTRMNAKNTLMDGLNTTNANTNNTNIVHNSSHTPNDNKLKLIVNSQSVSNSITAANNNNNNNNGLFSNNGLVTSNAISTSNNSNKLLSQSLSTTSAASLPGALPASGYLTQMTTSTTQNMSTASTTVATNQILKNAMAVSSLPNGSPSGSPSPSPLQQSLSTPSNAVIRPSGAPQSAPTTISLSAIQPSLVITPNKTSSVAPKPGQTLLIATSKDGSLPPMIVQPSVNPLHANNAATSGGTDATSSTSSGSVPTTSSIVTIASRNLVSTPGGTSVTGAQQPNLMQQLVSNPSSGPIQFQLVTNVNTSRPQTPNANIANRALAPRVVQLPPNVRLTQQLIRPGGGQGFTGQSTITLPSNLVRAGTIFVKTENGQVHMVNVGPPPTSTATAAPNLPQTYRLQVPTTSATTPAAAVRNLGNQHIVLPVSMAAGLHNKTAAQPTAPQSVNQPLHISTAAANQQSSATTPSQMSPNTAKKKCKNFLSTLIRLASDQPPNVANNVKNLIQGLIDDSIQPEDFTNQLQKELNSSPQPCLVPFLRKSLPYLRYSLMQKELTIDGVRPPPSGAVTLPPQSQHIPQIQIQQTPRPGMTPTVRLLTPVSGLIPGQTTTVLTPLSQPGARLATPQNVLRAQTPSAPPSRPSKSSSSKSRVAASKEKEKKNNFSSSLRDDDDINDVAAMGGVNLQEESQRILATNAEIVGQQIRSCKDEDFLYTTPLHKRINQIASKHGLEDCSQEVVSLVSHAVQERLKTLVEKLGVIAEHRQEQIKNYPNYDVHQDVKGQVMFLQELDRIEKRKHEEQEREVLIKAAKSRSKADDPDHLAIKMRAKEMQRQEMEELRQREANETALQAIGNPKKRLKTSFNTLSNNTSTTSFSSSSHSGLQSSFGTSSLKPMRRIKRVSLKDLHFLMEMEKETVRTPVLYKAYLK